MNQRHPWISRRVADEIYNDILQHQQDSKNGVHVFLIKAPAGAGKTYLARDIGTRLGSTDGYEPSEKDGILWSGILDLYDPTTNSNRGIEQLLIRAVSHHSDVQFKDYFDERKAYIKLSNGGTGGPPLEDQRRIVERAFSAEMRNIAREKHLVWAFDTIERIQSALDPTEAELGELGEITDTASVSGWLLDQITRIPKATILLFGRPAERFENRLKAALAEANYDRDKNTGAIKVIDKDLTKLSEDEIQDFFEFRKNTHPSLGKIITKEMQTLLVDRTDRNPLLLDIALQAIMETGNGESVRKALEKKGNATEIGKVLLQTYMNHSSPQRKTIISHLALARNGLSIELLKALESESPLLETELEGIAELPFVKTRHILGNSNEGYARPTYFLHDAMYAICDIVILRPVQAREDCKRIVKWYSDAINAMSRQIDIEEPDKLDEAGAIKRKDDPLSDLMVESLFYRLRADPKEGYNWYLSQAEAAFRSVKTGFEMRLRDAMAQFAINADPEGRNDSASSEIDRANIHSLFPDLWEQFKIDSAMMWVRRLSFRGRHGDAIRVAETATWAEDIYKQNPDRYRLSYTELMIWKAQSRMYLGEIPDAVESYQKNLELLKMFKLKTLEKNRANYDDFVFKRICFILGRTHNNLGYTYWMYLGRYKAALAQLSKALEFFRLGNLLEEEANTLDNMGRIHAILWHQPAARLFIEDGLIKRQKEKSRYRVALSEVSLATFLYRFGNSERALENADLAYETFNTMIVKRGVGLACLTRAMIRRDMAERGRENNLDIKKSLDYTQMAIDDLTKSIRIFKDAIQETIRYVYTLNEMGSCYRCLYLLRTLSDASDSSKQAALREGEYYYQEAIKQAEKYNYFTEILDSRQDLAVHYFRARMYDEALGELKLILNMIPADYFFQKKSGLKEIPEIEAIDVYYKVMGQVEMLLGAIVFDRAAGAKLDLQTIQDSMEHYLLAVGYLYRYSSISSNTYIKATERIYKRLSQCERSTIPEIKKYLDACIQSYRLPKEWAKPLFDEVFEMLGA